MDSIICRNHCNCGSRKPPFHSRLRMYHPHSNHWLLPSHQLIHQRHFISIVVYSFHIKFRNNRNILVCLRQRIGRELLLCLPILLLLFPLHAAIDTFILIVPLICRKLQMEPCWRGRSSSKTMATHHLSANDLVLLASFRNTYRILVDRSETESR